MGPASSMKPNSMGSLHWVSARAPPPQQVSMLSYFLNIPYPFDLPSQKDGWVRAKSTEFGSGSEGVGWQFCGKPHWEKGSWVCLRNPQDQVLSPSLVVRRLQVREELDRSSCGNVLFNGYLPPPGRHSQ